MLLMNPRSVRFGSATWENVASVAVARAAGRAVVEWGDAGPYPTFADVPEQTVTVTVKQLLLREDVSSPKPGDSGTFVVFTAPATSDFGRKKMSASAVVTGVAYDLEATKAVRTISLALVSSDGASDPWAVVDAGSEAV